MKTVMSTKIERAHVPIDAAGKKIGRLATEIATILRGKHKPSYTPHIDNGDFVVVENVDKLDVTVKKMEQKKYYSYSGYQGGLKTKHLWEIMEKNPGEALERAVREMLPNNKLRNEMMKRLIIKKTNQ